MFGSEEAGGERREEQIHEFEWSDGDQIGVVFGVTGQSNDDGCISFNLG